MTRPDKAMNRPADRCSECGQSLAHDQRYCVACGSRRLALPTRVAVAIGDLADRGARAETAAPAVPVAQPAAPDRIGELLPLARGAAVSILLMLGFGSVLGDATTPGGVTSLASSIVVALPTTHPAAPTTIAAVSTPGSGGGGATSGGGPGNGGGAQPPAPTVQAARTVTVSASAPAPAPATSATSSTPTSGPTTQLPPIHHVWEIVLSDQGYGQSFGDARADPYLARTLARQGTLISNYDAVAGSPLGNEVALTSGQGPTEQTLEDCPQYIDVSPGRTGRHGQIVGQGCLYPAAAPTLGSELQIQGLKWRAYIQGIGVGAQTSTSTPTTPTTPTVTPTTPASTTTSMSTATATATTSATTPSTSTSTPSATSTTSSSGPAATGSTSTSTTGSSTTTLADTSTAAGCPHPAEGAADPAGQVRGSNAYVTWKNPFVYFHALLDTTTCAQDDVGLGALASDLGKASTTPAFSYIAPDPCDDGSSSPCRPKAKDGLSQADRFLERVVPEIERSAAYKDDGLILITFDEAPQSGPQGSTASCCGQPAYPNLPKTSTTSTSSTTTTTSTPGTTSTTPSTLTSPLSTTTTTTTGSPVTPTCPTLTSPVTTSTSTSTSTTATTPTTTVTTPTSTSPSPTTSGTTSTTPASTGCAPAISGDPPGGGQVGMLMISPYVTANKVDVIDDYSHFSTLKSVAELLGVTPPGYAAETGIAAFNSALFTPTKH